MKALGIDQVANFPFPTPPPTEALQVSPCPMVCDTVSPTPPQAAEKTLQGLGALSSLGTITTMGHAMSQLPVAPRYARILTLGHQQGCLPYVISLVAALSVKVYTCTTHLLCPLALSLYSLATFRSCLLTLTRAWRGYVASFPASVLATLHCAQGERGKKERRRLVALRRSWVGKVGVCAPVLQQMTCACLCISGRVSPAG